MIRLFRNGVVDCVGDEEVMHLFEDSVVQWNDEFSGWSSDGAFLRVDYIPDVTEYVSTDVPEGKYDIPFVSLFPGTHPDEPVPPYLGGLVP